MTDTAKTHDLEIPSFLKRSKKAGTVDTPRLAIPSTPGGVRGAKQVPYKSDVEQALATVTKGKPAVAKGAYPSKRAAEQAVGKLAKPAKAKPAAKAKAKPAPKTKAAPKAKAKAAPASEAFSGKRGTLHGLITRKGGASYGEIKKACKWPSGCKGEMNAMARKLGRSLKSDKSAGDDQVFWL